MEPHSLVQTFNSLPRNATIPSGLAANTWHFSLRHIPLNPPATLLFIINPGSRFSYVEGPIPPTAKAEQLPLRATMYAMLLLKAFNSGLGMGASAGSRPWTWSTDDAEVAGAMGEVMRPWGVQFPMYDVGVAGEDEKRIADEEWDKYLEGLEGITGAG